MVVERRCPQCWKFRTPPEFVNERGRVVRMCAGCRAKYANWDRKTDAEKLAIHTVMPVPKLDGHRVCLRASKNRKTGPIPISMTDRSSCPPSCPLFGRGCYAEFHWVRRHWLSTVQDGVTWDRFCQSVAALPAGQLWRHNEAGDLPGKGDRVDTRALGKLVEANAGRRGWTYTHKPFSPRFNEALVHANRHGFTVNLSTLGLLDADAAASRRIAPVVVVLPHDTLVMPSRTPAGRKVVACRAGHGGVTCSTCGACSIADRDTIVAFLAHGQWQRHVSKLTG